MGSESKLSAGVLPDAGLRARGRQGGEAAYPEPVARHPAPVRAVVAMRLPIRHVVDGIAHEALSPLPGNLSTGANPRQ